MQRFLIISAVLLSGCMGNEYVPANPVPADLLVGCAGYSGPVPRNERQLAGALLSEVQGRRCANRKIETIAEIIGPQ